MCGSGRFSNRSCFTPGATPTISIGFESAVPESAPYCNQLADRILVGEQAVGEAVDR